MFQPRAEGMGTPASRHLRRSGGRATRDSCCGLCGRVIPHEGAHPIDSGKARASALAFQVANEMMVLQGKPPKVAVTQAVKGLKLADLAEKLFHEEQPMGEISPNVKPSRGIFRVSRLSHIPCDIETGMDIGQIRAAIEAAMRAKGFSRRSLSKAADLSESAVRDLMSRTDNPGIGTLRKIADALEMPVDQLTGAGLTVAVLGSVGAGGEILFSVDPDTELNESMDLPSVPRPPLVHGRLMALVVSGSSMLPKYEDGDIIYVRRDHEGILPAYLGRYCAVRTADGGTFLKILAAGSQAGRYTLRSLNAPDMDNVEVTWAAPVLFVMPKQADSII